MSVPMIASKAFNYAGRRLRTGDSFKARGESDARVLEAVRNARRDTQVPKAITDPVPAAQAPKRGRAYRRQVLEAQVAIEASPDSQAEASEAQASEQGTAVTPGAGSAEAAPQANASVENLPARGRGRYSRRDLAGAPE